MNYFLEKLQNKLKVILKKFFEKNLRKMTTTDWFAVVLGNSEETVRKSVWSWRRFRVKLSDSEEHLEKIS